MLKFKKLNNCKTAEQYDEYVSQYHKYYMASERIGIAKYKKIRYTDLNKAKAYVQKVKKQNSLAQIGVYSVCFPPHTVLPVNQIIG